MKKGGQAGAWWLSGHFRNGVSKVKELNILKETMCIFMAISPFTRGYFANM